MNRPARLLCLSALALAAAWPRTGHADLSKSRWQAPERPPGWPTLSLATSVAASAGAGALYVLKPARHLRWEGGAWLGVRLRSLTAHDEASPWGQVPLYYTTPLLPPSTIGSWSERGGYQPPRFELVSWEALRDTAPLSGIGAPLPTPSADVLRSHHVAATAPTGANAHSFALSNASGVAPGASREGSERSATGTTTAPGSSLGTYTMPALLRYSDEETNVLVTIQPGGPCTGACLRVAGSF